MTEGWQYCDAIVMIHRPATVQDGDRAGDRDQCPVIVIGPPIAPRDHHNPENFVEPYPE